MSKKKLKTKYIELKMGDDGKVKKVVSDKPVHKATSKELPMKQTPAKPYEFPWIVNKTDPPKEKYCCKTAGCSFETFDINRAADHQIKTAREGQQHEIYGRWMNIPEAMSCFPPSPQ